MITNNTGGTMFRKGNLIYVSSRGRSFHIVKSANSFFCEKGCAFYNNGMLKSNNDFISVDNDVAERSDGISYKKEGCTLFCSDGRSWTDIRSFDDFLDLLAVELICPWKGVALQNA